jgi:hypothetical protein
MDVSDVSDMKDMLRLELMTHMSTIGLPEVLRTLSQGVFEVGGRHFEDWDRDFQKVARALKDLAERVASFEEHYGSREP